MTMIPAFHDKPDEVSFTRYPAYKDSGVEWMGTVPAHWEVRPLKYIAEFVNGEAFKPTEWSDVGTPIIRIQNLNGGDTFNFFAGDVASQYHVRKGDLLFGWSGNRGTSFGPFIWYRDGLHYLNQHIFKVHPRNCDVGWLYWCLRAVTNYVEQEAHGIIGMVHVTKGKLGGIGAPLPGKAEQSLIAQFLNVETAKIDALIVEQSHLIELLTEKCQAVISHAVTKGLGPDAPMKPSGIEGLGDVPAHWIVAPIASRYDVQLGKMLDSTKITGEHLRPYLRVFDVQWASINVEDLPQMDFDEDARSKYRLLSGDLLVNEGGSYPGRSAIWSSPIDECYFQKALHRLRPQSNDKDTSRFLYYVMRWAAEQGVFVAGGNETTIEHLPADKLRRYRFAFPPLEEQLSIARFLDLEVARMGDLTAEAQRAIDVLQERRIALISAAVTGQVDVRELALAEAA